MREGSRSIRRILFVCMGNICRSPAAEGVFQSMIADAGMDGELTCDSAGTIDYHQDEVLQVVDHLVEVHPVFLKQ